MCLWEWVLTQCVPHSWSVSWSTVWGEAVEWSGQLLLLAQSPCTYFSFFLSSQLWISSTRSTCCTAPSQTFALRKSVPSCLLVPSKSETSDLHHVSLKLVFSEAETMLNPAVKSWASLKSSRLLNVFCRYEYHWADGTNIKKPIKCSAPKYIDYLMTWVQDQLDDETLFPSKIGKFGENLNVCQMFWLQ